MNHAASLTHIAAALRSGSQPLLPYIEQMLDQLDAEDGAVQAFVPELDRRARVLADAQALIDRYPDPASRPLLYGVPVGIKDIFRVDGVPTRAGSAVPPDVLAAPEAACVSILKQQGALVLGKTVTAEFACFQPGPTRNPRNLAHTPGGSSSGSAAAVAAGFCPLAIGTQTIGSIIRPAAFCGIVGFKPSYGRIDPAGVIYVAPSLDHVGLFTQDVAGMQLAASTLCRDWQPVENPGQPVLGVPDGPYLRQASAEGLAAFERQVERLQAAGFVVKRVSLLHDIEAMNHRHRELMAYEMAQTHQAWFADHAEQYSAATAALIERGQGISRVAAQADANGQRIARQQIEAHMLEHGIDVWISPAAVGAAPEGIESTGDPVMNLPWSHTGQPTITIPIGVAANGLPLGLQCSAAFGQDERLLAWAAVIEDRFPI